MVAKSTLEKPRQRAASPRALATHARILNAAERVFASHGFDGASMRKIAEDAGEQVGLVHHHGGGKERLFHQTVARRAQELSLARIDALAKAKSHQPTSVQSVLTAFFKPYFELSRTGPQWFAYARLVAHVSADPRWHNIAADCFDPTARIFLDEISELLPNLPKTQIATNFVFSVSAMLALFTSQQRIETLGGSPSADKEFDDFSAQLDQLITFCAAGFLARF